MRRSITRLAATLLIASAVVAAATTRPATSTRDRDLTDSLHRAQLEQELILAEGTAAMYGRFEEVLADMSASREEGGDQ